MACNFLKSVSVFNELSVLFPCLWLRNTERSEVSILAIRESFANLTLNESICN